MAFCKSCDDRSCPERNYRKSLTIYLSHNLAAAHNLQARAIDLLIRPVAAALIRTRQCAVSSATRRT